MLIGYARVSTSDQSLNLQLDALATLGCEKICQDVASGARIERPGLDEALTYLRKGDTLVVWRAGLPGILAPRQPPHPAPHFISSVAI